MVYEGLLPTVYNIKNLKQLPRPDKSDVKPFKKLFP
jgi:hypothetical protein